MDISFAFLIAGAILLASLIIALGASRVGLPSLVAFLGLGMLLGTDGPLGFEFNNAELAQVIGTIGLVLILFEGGLSTSWRRLRNVAVPASVLSTVGVLVTAVLTGYAAYAILNIPLLYALLIGAVVSSTDAAAVFSSMRSSKIKLRLARTLEAESGINDPMAIALTIGLITWISNPVYNINDIGLLVIQQLGIGFLAGALLGSIAVKLFSKLPQSIGVFAPVASLTVCALTFGITQIAGGSGFLAVYIVGLAIGSTPSRYRSQLTAFHEGLAFLAQIIMFTALGLLVNPRELTSIAGTGIVLAILLAVAIRPIAVWISLATSSFSNKERLFIGWAGLRGAVPIVLGTFVLSANISNANTIFNIVFFVVLVSALFQGATIEKLANKLKLTDAVDPSKQQRLDFNRQAHIKFIVSSDHAIAGAHISEVGLPKNAIVATIKRGANKYTPTNKTIIRINDELRVVFPESLRAEVEDTTVRWRRRI